MDKNLMFEELELMEEMVSDEYLEGYLTGLGMVFSVASIAGFVVAVSLT